MMQFPAGKLPAMWLCPRAPPTLTTTGFAGDSLKQLCSKQQRPPDDSEEAISDQVLARSFERPASPPLFLTYLSWIK